MTSRPLSLSHLKWLVLFRHLLAEKKRRLKFSAVYSPHNFFCSGSKYSTCTSCLVETNYMCTMIIHCLVLSKNTFQIQLLISPLTKGIYVVRHWCPEIKAGLLNTGYTREPLCSMRLQTPANSLTEMPAITDSQSFVVIDKGGVAFGNKSVPDISLETVHMNGGLLFKDGTAKWCGKSQDEPT